MSQSAYFNERQEKDQNLLENANKLIDAINQELKTPSDLSKLPKEDLAKITTLLTKYNELLHTGYLQDMNLFTIREPNIEFYQKLDNLLDILDEIADKTIKPTDPTSYIPFYLGLAISLTSDFVMNVSAKAKQLSFRENMRGSMTNIQRMLILKTLYEEEPMSMTQLVKKTGLQKSIVEKEIQQLMDINCVYISDEKNSKKKGTNYKLSVPGKIYVNELIHFM